jgi:hypothetical protein
MIRVFNEQMGGDYISTVEMADTRAIRKTMVSTLCKSITKTATAAREAIEGAGGAAGVPVSRSVRSGLAVGVVGDKQVGKPVGCRLPF